MNPLERQILGRELSECAFRAALRLHAVYHGAISNAPCAGVYLDGIPWITADRNADARLRLRLWARWFLRGFDRTHPWPAAVRAAYILRKRFRSGINLERLASRVGSSTSALVRGFQRYYGTSTSGYQIRARMRWAVRELRLSGSNVEAVALLSGYRSAEGFYGALQAATGLTPSEVRQLTDDEVRALYETQLKLSFAVKVPVFAQSSPETAVMGGSR